MKNKLLILSIITFLLGLTSCMDGGDCSNTSSLKIKLVAEIENPHSQKRSSKAGFNENDNIGIYFVDYVEDTPMPIGTMSSYMNTEYIYNGTYWNDKNGEDMYLPTDEAKGDIYAYYPFDYEMSRHPDKMNPEVYSFSIETDQSLSSTKSDFLWAYYPAVSIQNTTARLTFKHLFSKIILNITYGNLGNNYESMLIHNLSKESIIDLGSGMVWETGDNFDIKPYIHSVTNPGFDKTLSAIVVPQFAYKGKLLFSVDIENERYGYILDQTVYMESGMMYTFNIIIGDANTRTNNKTQNTQNRVSLASKSTFN